MADTKIPYVDKVWNPVVGCTKCSPGCENCYAEELHSMRHKAYLAGKKLPKQYAMPFSEIQLLEKRLEIPLHWRKPRKILVPSMGDLFHKDVPFEFIKSVLGIIALCPQHHFLLLTKRIERAAELSGAYPDNTYLGVTICNQAEADEKIPILLQIPAAHHWISFEPLLGPIEFVNDSLLCQRESDDESSPVACIPCLCGKHWINQCMHDNGVRLECINQVIIGCESGPKRRPIARKHIKSLYDQCKAAGVDVMVKQMAENEDGTGKVIHDLARIEQALTQGS